MPFGGVNINDEDISSRTEESKSKNRDVKNENSKRKRATIIKVLSKP